jgi:hypothetical protein
MTTPVAKLATKDDAAELIDLLCSASREIGLKGRVCRPENRSKLLKWMKGECEAQRVWTQTDGSTLQGAFASDQGNRHGRRDATMVLKMINDGPSRL